MKIKLEACIISEQDDGECISLLLKKEFPEIEIVFQANSIEYAYNYLHKNPPDILFLDTSLANDKVSDYKNFLQTIFIANTENSAIQVIKKGITDYILKPVKKLDFVIAVNRAIENLKKQKYVSPQNKISLPTLQGFKRVAVSEIIRCEADSNYTFIYLSDKTKVIVSKTLHDFEKYLLGYNFFRIHHKHLINLEHLKEYIKGKGGQVIMTDDSVLNVSIRRKNEFLQKFT